MKLNFDIKKKNTAGIQFRIDPDTKKKMNALKKFYEPDVKEKYISCSKLVNEFLRLSEQTIIKIFDS